MKVAPGPIRSFEDLECWKACRNLRRFVSELVPPQLSKSGFDWVIKSCVRLGRRRQISAPPHRLWHSMSMGLKALGPTESMLVRRTMLPSGSSDITQDALARQRPTGRGHLLHRKCSKRDPVPAGSNTNSRNLGENGSGGFSVMQSEPISRPGATRRREGYGRFHFLDKAKFCSNARGSC